MRNEISKIIQEIEGIALNEYPYEPKRERAYDITEGLDELIAEMDKGSETVEYLKKLDNETVKVLRLLWQIGKENYHDPEYNFKHYPTDEGKIERLKEIFQNLLKDDKRIDIDVVSCRRIGEYMKKGYAEVFK